jgi:hypothetical protein
LLVLVAGCVALATPAAAGEWRPVAQGDSFVAGIDYSRVNDTGGRKQVWVIKSFRRPDQENTSYTLSRVEIDCRGGTYRRMSLAGYSNAGQSIYSMQPTLEIEQVIPDTVNDRIMTAVCEGTRFSDISTETSSELHSYILQNWW